MCICGIRPYVRAKVEPCVHMDFTDGFPGHFRDFAKDEFEADWTKMAECRFSQVYDVKLKAWQEKCVLKCFHPTLCSKSSYRLGATLLFDVYAKFLYYFMFVRFKIPFFHPGK